MKINKLYIKSFGKLKNREIVFDDGLNLVYGDNEAGKSTMHKFIQGMFFGFYKPYTKNKKYSDEYERYKPWNSDTYAGSLEFYIGDKQFRIERNFLKSSESFKLFDNVTGVELTDKLPYDPVIKQPSIAPLIKINSVLFNNTISIAQLGNKTEKDFKKEISETLANFEKGASNNISVNKAIESLQRQMSEIGTSKQSKSEFGSSILKLSELKNEKKRALEFEERYRNYFNEIKSLDVKVNALKDKKAELMNQISLGEVSRDKSLYLRYKEIEEENSQLQERADELEKYKDIKNSAYRQFLNLTSENNAILKQLEDIEDKKEKIYDALDKLQEESSGILDITKGNSYNKIVNDINILKDRLGNIDRLSERLSQKQDDKIESDFSAKLTTNKVLTILLIISVVASIFLVGFSFTISPKFKIPGYISLGCVSVLLFLKVVIALVFKKTSKKFEKYDTSLIRTENMIELNQVEIDKLLQEYGEEDPYELIGILEENSKYAKNVSSYVNKSEQYNMQLDDLEEEEASLNEQKANITASVNTLLAQNNMEDASQFQEALEQREIYEITINKIDSNNRLLENILKGTNLNALKAKFENGEDTFLEEENVPIVENASDKIDQINEVITAASEKRSRLAGALDQDDNNLENLCEINEDIKRYENKIKAYKSKLESLNIAIKTINNVSKNIHSSVAPNLNQSVGQIMSSITNGRYSTVKVSENMNVMVLDEKSGKMVNAERLSNGTIDQIYFALRLSITDNVLPQNSKLPIILDDCFVQYDFTRLNEIIRYLGDLVDEKQVIIFTCHDREEKAILRNNIEYKKVLV